MNLNVTIVVPTFHEEDNVPELVRRLGHSMESRRWQGAVQLLFVDDSKNDLTANAAQRLAELYNGRTNLTISWIRRSQEERRRDGLAGAILRGITNAKFERIVVCDGDLQHPPEELLPVAVCLASGVDMVLPTRWRYGGSAPGFNLARYLISRATGFMTWAFFPVRLRDLTDRTSGFFAINRDKVDMEGVRPMGFKFLLEILVRCAPLRFMEYGYTFDPRSEGDSKATKKQLLLLVKQLLIMRYDMWFRKPAKQRAEPLIDTV